MRTLLWLGCLILMAQAEAAPYVPPALEPWRQWVLEAHPELGCPVVGPASKRLCHWPSELQLSIAPERGDFSMTATLYAPGWLSLPGDDRAWPLGVTSGGRALAVQRLNSQPAVYLPAGPVTVQGHWQWSAPPRDLTVPADVGRVALEVAGQAVTTPRWSGADKLLLQMQSASRDPGADNHSLAVHRLLEDGLPQTLTTQLQLTVSGRARTLSLGPLLPAEFRVTGLASPLPAQLGADGRLTLEARPGYWTLDIRAVRSEPAETLAVATADGWPDQELWAFAAAPTVRTVRIGGAPQIDAKETALPDAWRSYPVYLLSAEAPLQLEVVQRGAAERAPRLQLNRTIWWDFDGGGATVRDTVSGDAADLTRLEVEPPLELGRAELEGEPLLITRQGERAPAGVELRAGNLNLTAVSRMPPLPTLPVGGWHQDFEQVDHHLQLPPGWHALHLAGAPQVRGTWLSQWNLWNIFSVLIIAIGLGRVSGRGIGLLALATLVFTYHRPGAPLLGWVVLLAASALAPHIKGIGKRWLAAALGVGLLAILWPLLPYSVHTARQLLYPQLQDMTRQVTASGDAMSVKTMAGRGEAAEYDLSLERSVAPPPAPRYQAKQDPNARIQAGPGLPDWYAEGVSAHWAGPVAAGQTLRWWLAPPWLTNMGLAVGLLLPWALLGWLGLRVRPYLSQFNLARQLPGASAATAAVLVSLSLGQSPNAQADVDAELLKQLESRLTQLPPCAPQCAQLAALEIDADANDLTLTFSVHMAADSGVRLPLNTRDWQPRSVSLQPPSVSLENGGSPPLSQRGGKLWVALPAGIHRLTLTGPAPAERLDLVFDTPHTNVSHNLTGWTVSGLQRGSQTLQLERAADSPEGIAGERSAIAPYAIITRRFELNVDWRVVTEVQRLAPESGAMALAVPLLPGEVPQRELEIVRGVAQLQLADGEGSFSWSSALPVVAKLSVTAPANAAWTERWEIAAGPIWHLDYDGPPPTGAAPGRLSFQPEPGESLALDISRPAAIPGSALAFDAVQVITRPGGNLTEVDLHLTLRATYGGEVVLPLPSGSEVLGVSIDDASLPAKHEADNLRLPLTPGTHQVEIKLRYAGSDRWLTRTPPLALPAPAANIALEVQLPGGRWPLWVAGPQVGPEILFWSVAAIVLALAAVLARYRLTPLKLYEWALLSLGIATINIYLVALIAAWLMAYQWRGGWRDLPPPRAFKLWQLCLAALGLIATLALVTSIPYSLLAAPEMYVSGNGSSAHYLRWYQDRVDGALPSAQVFSAPLLAYRLLMLGWSIWLAFALIRWIGWSWLQWRQGGFWPPRAKQEPQPQPPAAEV